MTDLGADDAGRRVAKFRALQVRQARWQTENRENNREVLKISRDSGLCGPSWEPVAKRIQQLAANSLLLRKQGFFCGNREFVSLSRELSGNGPGAPEVARVGRQG